MSKWGPITDLTAVEPRPRGSLRWLIPVGYVVSFLCGAATGHLT